jgi:hypothetical protein
MYEDEVFGDAAILGRSDLIELIFNDDETDDVDGE